MDPSIASNAGDCQALCPCSIAPAFDENRRRGDAETQCNVCHDLGLSDSRQLAIPT